MKKVKKGKLIVIEGTDGSGKGTQLKLLAEYFKRNKIPFAVFDFPQYDKTFFGDFVGRFLNGEFGHFSRINPYLAMFPYAGDRWQVKDKIYQALNQKKIVVCNRYAPSISYQLAKVKPKDRYKFLQWAEELEYKVFGIPKEDLVIFLYVPLEIAQKLIGKKGKRLYLKNKTKDQYEENINYLKKVEKMYLWLNQTKKNWYRIDCIDKKGNLLSPEQIHKMILKKIII
ncbi:MAG: thymidylate kinase [Microgenomates group bacterium]|nr:thymidylate kinase [Microgenomates group bacterium]